MMARLNAEAEYWGDIRRSKLAIKLGCQFKADGVMLNAWRLAQEYWCPEKRLIPKRAWQEAGIPSEVFECALADDRGDEVYVRGSEKKFAWYFERLESAKKGGLASAAKRRLTKGQAEVDQRSSKSNQTQPSSSSSSSSSKETTRNYLSSEQSKRLSSEECIAELLDEPINELLAKTSVKIQRAWLSAYTDPNWIKGQIRQANLWLIANPHKQPKSNFSRFLNSWLQRAWENHRKTLPSKKIPAQEPVFVFKSEDPA